MFIDKNSRDYRQMMSSVGKKNSFGKSGSSKVKSVPKYLLNKDKKGIKRAQEGLSRTLEYRIFQFDITIPFLGYVEYHAKERELTPIQLIKSVGADPMIYRRVKNGVIKCPVKYCMFIVSLVGKPLVLVA